MRDWFMKQGNGEIGNPADAGNGKANAAKKGRITLSIDDAVKEVAATYAEHNGTSVSALVEAYLASMSPDAPARRRKPSADEMRKLHGTVLTGEGGLVRGSGHLSSAAYYYEPSVLLVDEEDPFSPSAMLVRAALRAAGYEIKAEWSVPGADVAVANSSEAARVNRLPAMQVAFLGLLGTAAKAGCNRFDVAAERFSGWVRLSSAGIAHAREEAPADWAADLCCAAFNMSDASDASYRPLDYQSARISNVRTSLPDGIGAVRMQFNPMPDGGRHMSCFLVAGENASACPGVEPKPEGFADIGLPRGQAELLRRAAEMRTGLCIVSGWSGSGRTRTLRAAMTEKSLAAGGSMHLAAVEDPYGPPIPGVERYTVANAATEQDRNEKFRQAVQAALSARPGALMTSDMRDRDAYRRVAEAAASGIQIWTSMLANSAHAALATFRERSQDNGVLLNGDFPVTVVWQRLFSSPCPCCSKPLSGAKAEAMLGVLAGAGVDPGEARVASRAGCEACSGTGRSGRALAAEILQPDPDTMDALHSRDFAAAATRIRVRSHVGTGFRPALDRALFLIGRGRVDPYDALSTFGHFGGGSPLPDEDE